MVAGDAVNSFFPPPEEIRSTRKGLRLHDNPDLKGDGGKPKDGEQELRVLEKFIDFDCHGDSGEDQHHNRGRNDEPDRKGSAP